MNIHVTKPPRAAQRHDVTNMRREAQRAVVASQRRMSPETDADMEVRSRLSCPRAAFLFDGEPPGSLAMLDPDAFEMPVPRIYTQHWETITSGEGGFIRICLFVDQEEPGVHLVKAHYDRYGHGSPAALGNPGRSADTSLACLLGCLAALKSPSSRIIPPVQIPLDTPLKRRRQLEASARTIVRLGTRMAA